MFAVEDAACGDIERHGIDEQAVHKIGWKGGEQATGYRAGNGLFMIVLCRSQLNSR